MYTGTEIESKQGMDKREQLNRCNDLGLWYSETRTWCTAERIQVLQQLVLSSVMKTGFIKDTSPKL